MKTSLVKILIIFSFLSCEINKDKIKKTWVGKYRVSHSNSEGKGISEIGLRNIIKFDNDSLLIKNFQLSLIDDNKEQVSLQYELVKNQILTSKDTFNIQNIFTDSLIISLNQGNSKKIVYEELSRYNHCLLYTSPSPRDRG